MVPQSCKTIEALCSVGHIEEPEGSSDRISWDTKHMLTSCWTMYHSDYISI